MSSVTMPDSMTYMGSYCFADDLDLTSIIIPSGIDTIYSGTFYNCYRLANVSFPSTLKMIGDRAFTGSGITSAVLPQGLNWLDLGVFYRCDKLASVVLPDSMTYIGENCFSYDSMLCSPIVIPAGIDTLRASCFFGCSSIPSVVLPEGVTVIDTGAFAYCHSLRTVYLPSTLQTIGLYGFYDCPGVDTITLACTTPPTVVMPNRTLYCYSATLIVPCGSANTYRQHATWGRFANVEENCDGIDETVLDDVKIYARDRHIVVEGAYGEAVRIYDVMGRPVSSQALPTGVYMVKVGDLPAKKVVVVK